MSVYKNPKDGSTLSQMPKIATNIEMVDAPQEEYVTQAELTEAESILEDKIAKKVDWVTQGKLGAKNLIPYPYEYNSGSNQGVDFTTNSDGSITLNGTAPDGGDSQNIIYNNDDSNHFILGEGTYKLSCIGIDNTTMYIQFLVRDSLHSWTAIIDANVVEKNTFTITQEIAEKLKTNEYKTQIKLGVKKGKTVENATIYLMLRYATDTDTTYQPYAMTNKELTDNVNALNDLPIKKGSGQNSARIGYILSLTANGINAVAEGLTTQANGNNSHAEGQNTKATATNSHAEGNYTLAQGVGSHAEGGATKALGNYSHAEGQDTKSEGTHSHAEGYNTEANGQNTHSEGAYTYALGNQAHSEGQDTNANGHSSHAQNRGTTAQGFDQTTIGTFNVINGTPSSKVDTDYALIVGNGTDTDHRSNALAVQWDGTVVFQDGSKQNSGAIPIADLKTLVAASSDFADFQTRIAAL